MAKFFEQVQLGSCSMGRFQQRYHGCEYGLVEQLDHKQLDPLRSDLEHTWQQKAKFFVQDQLGSCSMGQFQQHCRGCEYGLVELLSHRQPSR